MGFNRPRKHTFNDLIMSSKYVSENVDKNHFLEWLKKETKVIIFQNCISVC